MGNKTIQSSSLGKLMLKTLGITLLAFTLSVGLEAPFTASTSAIFSSAEKNDFIISDFFAQIADHRPVRQLDDRIAVIDIGLANRDEIAQAVDMLSLTGPRAIGLDINFEDPHEDDSRLLEAISYAPDLVLPLGVRSESEKFVIDEKPFFYDQIEGPQYGVINMPGKNSRSSIREFAVQFPMVDGDTLNSFVTQLAEIVDPDAVKALKARKNDYETTAYHSRQFKIYHISQIEEHAEDFTDKIVLIGALSDANDMHSTPVNSYMSGVMIHAHALSTILDQSWYTHLPRYADYIIAFILCYFIIFATVGITNGVRGLVVRLLQVLLAYIAVRIGYSLYVDHNIVCNFSSTLLMIAFGLFAVDIWNGAIALYKLACEKIPHLYRRVIGRKATIINPE